VFEDIDRSSLFDRYSRGVSENCFMNMLDGIDEGYGRITIMTCNDISALKKNRALIRRGRTDTMVEVPMCDHAQTMKILPFHYSDYQFTIKQNIVIAPATLIQLITVLINPPQVEWILNHTTNWATFDIAQITLPSTLDNGVESNGHTQIEHTGSNSEEDEVNPMDHPESSFMRVTRRYAQEYCYTRRRLLSYQTQINLLTDSLDQLDKTQLEELEKKRWQVRSLTRRMTQNRAKTGDHLASMRDFQINIMDYIKKIESDQIDVESKHSSYTIDAKTDPALNPLAAVVPSDVHIEQDNDQNNNNKEATSSVST